MLYHTYTRDREGREEGGNMDMGAQTLFLLRKSISTQIIIRGAENPTPSLALALSK
jgi:hypothetical protein